MVAGCGKAELLANLKLLQPLRIFLDSETALQSPSIFPQQVPENGLPISLIAFFKKVIEK